eukprot:TRINITY_DN47055_c0_g1_i1.p1 TRINITY_DN47055_c0_g1~~TRINITY_DN47055_c0_g1_i1.p1  ORF type:complete len:410 (-),score=37.19 TRINITY_DN47055_c0_g1_i1:118-1347(-)
MSGNAALVVGCSGLVGSHVLEYLVRSNRFGRVVGSCGRSVLPFRIRDIATNPGTHVDFLTGVDLLDLDACTQAFGSSHSRRLRNGDKVPAGFSHVFYCAWRGSANTDALLQNASVRAASKDEAEASVNLSMLQNTVKAVASQKTNHASPPTHVALLEGTKWYGVHLGPRHLGERWKTPFEESDERVCPAHLFYYRQEDWLRDYARSSGGRVSWSATRPFCVVGYTEGSTMNFGTALAAYATLLKAKGLPLVFPGNAQSWTTLTEFTDVHLLARMMSWCGQSEHDGHAYNIVNGDLSRWQYLWPKLAQYFAMEAVGPSDYADVLFDELFGSSGCASEVWSDVVAKHDLKPTTLADVLNPLFLRAVLSRDFDVITSMSKARRAGFRDYVDTQGMFCRLFQELRQRRIIPNC